MISVEIKHKIFTIPDIFFIVEKRYMNLVIKEVFKSSHQQINVKYRKCKSNPISMQKKKNRLTLNEDFSFKCDVTHS